MKGKRKPALIFIDTNIYLDFYRIRRKTFESSMIHHIDENRDKIISTDQIFMEYKKNRQSVILDALKSIGKSDVNINPPAFLSETKIIEKINQYKKKIKLEKNKLEKRILDVLKNPVAKDQLYQCLQRLFSKNCEYHLGRKDDIRFEIRELAMKRFQLGYPPRKKNDNSIGDAINWEWIIRCAKNSEMDIMIVSRDEDYGSMHGDKPILNDWLSYEFKDRISRKRKITLTDKLSVAFKNTGVAISEKEEKEEEEFLADKSRASSKYFNDIYKILEEQSFCNENIKKNFLRLVQLNDFYEPSDDSEKN